MLPHCPVTSHHFWVSAARHHLRQFILQHLHRSRQSVAYPRSLPSCPFPAPASGALFPIFRLPCTLQQRHRGSNRPAACIMLRHHTWTQEAYLSAYQSHSRPSSCEYENWKNAALTYSATLQAIIQRRNLFFLISSSSLSSGRGLREMPPL